MISQIASRSIARQFGGVYKSRENDGSGSLDVIIEDRDFGGISVAFKVVESMVGA